MRYNMYIRPDKLFGVKLGGKKCHIKKAKV